MAKDISNRNSDVVRSDPSRRKFLKQAGLLTAGIQAASFLPASLAAGSSGAGSQTTAKDSYSDVIAETTYGKVRGLRSNGVNCFTGIHYGADTSGKGRFMPPAKPASWTGVRDAVTWGPISPMPIQTGAVDYMRMIDWLNQPGGMSEDCLVLNVWTPGVKDGRKRTVMFWLHGGGYTTGSANNPAFNGERLARKGDVVVVSINHRLGCFGYLDLDTVGAPSQFAPSGNVGMLDAVAALEWVRDNIENFGGDPGSVMIFGQSGGGSKVCTLLTMPAAKGLFHRAIIESGSALRATTRESAQRSAEKMLATVGLPKSRVLELQDLPVEQMVAAQLTLSVQPPPAGFAPVVDGSVLPRHPFDPDASPLSADIPIMVGSMTDDSALNRTDFDLDEAGLRDAVKKIAGEGNADKVIAAYRQAYPDASPFKLEVRILTDHGGRKSAITLSERKYAQHAAPVYNYVFAWPSPAFGGRYGSVHGTEVPLVFLNPDAIPLLTGNGPESHAMAEKMSSVWLAFAKTGNPNTSGIPQWPAFTPDTRATMIFNLESRVENDPHSDLRQLWEQIAAQGAGSAG
jgi:para-nitrobenzyl esterase